VIAIKDSGCGAPGNRNYALYQYAPDDRLTFSIDNCGTIASDDQLTRGRWHHVAASFDSAENMVRFYIDGHFDSAKPYVRNLADGLNSANVITGTSFYGMIDDLRIYTKAYKGGG